MDALSAPSVMVSLPPFFAWDSTNENFSPAAKSKFVRSILSDALKPETVKAVPFLPL